MLATVNGLLGAAGIPLSSVRLVRHAGQRKRLGNRSAFDLWQSGQSAFEDFQAVQKPHCRFKPGEVIASFVATPSDETLFIGLYDVEAISPLDTSWLESPLVRSGFEGHGRNQFAYYHLKPRLDYETLHGRMVIDWGGSARSWVQRADRQNKPIVEVRRDKLEPAFPGFENFTVPLCDLATIPASWQAALQAVSGIYLLTCLECGRAYVGSASGEGGLWQRFQAYAANGHGGNVELQRHARKTFQVSILEVMDKAAPRKRVLNREQIWKLRLQTRECGLNLN